MERYFGDICIWSLGWLRDSCQNMFLTAVVVFYKWQRPWPCPRPWKLLVCSHPVTKSSLKANRCSAHPVHWKRCLRSNREQKFIRPDSEVGCSEMQPMWNKAHHASLVPSDFRSQNWVSSCSSTHDMNSTVNCTIICRLYVNFWWLGKVSTLLGYSGLYLGSLPSSCRLERLWKRVGWSCQKHFT